MSSPRSGNFERARRAFETLIDLAPADRREALAALRTQDPEVAEAVEGLLAADSDAGSFLEAPAGESARELVVDWLDGERQSAGALVGSYRLIRLLGRGGMGEVWEAERADGQFEHTVAVKLLKRGMDSEEILARFLRERQILARLGHPGIARLLDGGIAPDGRPYFVMEKVDGVPLTEHARDRRLTIADRIRLTIAVCEAVESAHRQLVVHRDLKPTNILVTAKGELKLLDFGIAKLLGEDDGPSRTTALGMHALTPAYAAPEQVLGEPVTTATDVYALGVVLCELLTGRLPHSRAETSAVALAAEVAGASALRVTTLARQLDPETAARLGLPDHERKHLDRRLAGDLETILVRALDRTPDRRYASVNEFGADLTRYLQGRPVHARPDSPRYRITKFVERHRAAVAAAFLLLVSLVGGLSAALWQADRAERNAATAAVNHRRAERVQAFLIQLFAGSDPDHVQSGRITARELVDEGTARIATELEGEPEVQAALWDALSQIEGRLGRLESAERLARAALAERLRRLPASDPQVALVRMTLAESLFGRGEIDSAMKELEMALPGLEEALGRDGDEAMRVHRLLLAIHMHRGDNRAALASSSFVLERSRRRTGGESLETAQSLAEHAMVLASADRYAEAEAAAAASVALFAHRLSPDHVRTAKARMTWGEMLHLLGRRDEGEREMRAALPILRSGLGAGHPEVGQLLLRLGSTAVGARRLEEADRYFAEALAVFEPLDHYETGSCLRMLGQVAFAREDYRRAQGLYERAFARFLSTRGADDQLSMAALGNLGMTSVRLGDLRTGRKQLIEAIDGHVRLFGADADELRSLLLVLGEAERLAGDPAAALAHHRRALAIAEKTVGLEHVGAANARREIALDLAATGKPAELGEARTMLDHAVKTLTAIDPEHPRLGEWMLDSARLARAAGDGGRMRQDAAEAARRLTAARGEADPRAREARRLATTA